MKNRVVIGLGLLVVSGVLLSGCIALCAVLTFATQPMGTVGDSVAVIRVEGTIVSGRPKRQRLFDLLRLRSAVPE